MPHLAKRPCSVCGNLGCTAHQRDYSYRNTTACRGYDAAHKRLRVLCFMRDEWRCIDCGWEPEIVKDFREAGLQAPSSEAVLRMLKIAFAKGERHLHADHQVPIDQAEELRLDLDNLKTRCNVCHATKTAREDGGFGRAVVASKPLNPRDSSGQSASVSPFQSVL